jgi:hypothetical protein
MAHFHIVQLFLLGSVAAATVADPCASVPPDWAEGCTTPELSVSNQFNANRDVKNTTLPSSVKYIGFYAVMKGGEDSFNFTNLVFGWPNNINSTILNNFARQDLKFMFYVTNYFINGSELFSDYQDRWDEVVPKYKKLAQQGKLAGFSVGDEVMSQSNLTLDIVHTLVNTVRASFPRGSPGSVIWWNENNGWISSGRTFPLPKALDWFSTDIYRGGNNCQWSGKEFVTNNVKSFYSKFIFPNLNDPNQRVALVPGAKYRPTDCTDACRGDAACLARSLTDDVWALLDWARADSRIEAITPYTYKSFPPEYGLKDLHNMCPKENVSACSALFDAWSKVGLQAKARSFSGTT